MRLPEGWRYEIDEGELIIMPPAGFEHGEISAAVVTALQTHVRAHHLGVTLTNEPGFRLRRGPDTLRAPDVAFVSNERLARVADRRRFSEVPPDLAVEVLSPSDANVDMERKVQQYLAAGVRSVWILDPAAGTLRQIAAGGGERVTTHPDAIVEDPVLPGFHASLRELLGR